MKYKSIWFDLGMTLVEPFTEKAYRQVLERLGIKVSSEAVKRAFYQADKTFMREYPHVLGSNPDIFLPWYIGVANYHLGVKTNLQQACLAYREEAQQQKSRWRLIPGAKELLLALRRQGVHTGLLSNWDASCREVLRQNGLDVLLQSVVISSEVGAEKPDSAIFEAALRLVDIPPEQTLFVGDNYYDDVLGARKCNIQCLLLAPYGRLGMEEIDYRPTIASIGEVLNHLE